MKDAISAKFAILGSGPAGVAAAAHLRSFQQDFVWVSPNLGTPWPHFLGMWLDEATELGVTEHLANRWPDVEVRFSSSSAVALDRTYVRLDNASLYREWTRNFDSDGGLFRASALSVEQKPTNLLVTLADGRRVQCDYVLDARGPRSLATSQNEGKNENELAQRAYGVVLRSSAQALSKSRATLMDFSAVSTTDETRVPTFLYALPLNADTFLLEETSLAHAPPISISALRERLWARLAARGIEGEVLEEEHVHIPLAPPIPPRANPCIPLGAAAALINPMSGYSLPAGIAHARECVDFLVQGIQAGRSAPELRDAWWKRTWTPERRMERKIRLFGIDVLNQLNLRDTQTFLKTLFFVNSDSWKILLGHRTRPAELIAAMQATFRALPFPLQIKASLGISRHLDLLMHLSRYRFALLRPQPRS